MTLRQRQYLTEMAALPSLKQLQRRGNKKPATKKELQNARKRALRLKSAPAAREAAKFAWEMMEKAQIIQVFLDREAELISPKHPVAKPLILDKKIVKWSQINKADRDSAIRWIGATKTELQLNTLLKQAKSAKKRKATPDAVAKVAVYEAALKEWKRVHKIWREAANKTRLYFGS